MSCFDKLSMTLQHCHTESTAAESKCDTKFNKKTLTENLRFHLHFYGNDTGEINSLEANNLYKLTLKAKLAVLSSCETGNGKFYHGEGVLSFARSFSYAGCPSIIMSCWKINDQSTSQQIITFYQKLLQKHSLNHSLNEAKTDYLKNADEIHSHPAYWASLALWETIPPPMDNHSHLIAILMIAFAIFCLIFIGRKIFLKY